MNLLGGPALVSGVLNLILATIAWLHRRRDRMNIALALFTAGLALLSFGRFFVMQCRTEQQALTWYHLPHAIYPLVIGAALYYVLTLTGYLQRLSERVLGISLRVYLIVAIVLLASAGVVLQVAPELFKQMIWDPQQDAFESAPRRTWVAVQVVLLPLLLVFFSLLVRRLRESEPGPYKRFLWLNAFGIVFIFMSAPLIVRGLTLLDLPGPPFIFVGTTISSAIFYFALVRYQFDQVQQLNVGLERKVAERTRHLREAQAKLVQADKMASLGRLVAGVAHEFNNPIGAVQSTNATLQLATTKLETLIGEQLPADAPDRFKIDRTIAMLRQGNQVIEEGAQRVDAIVRRLKAFVRLDEAELQLADVHDSIEQSLGLLPPGWHQRIALQRSYHQDLPKVLCYPAKLNQALHCVLANAVEAIEKTGEIEIKTALDDEHVIVAIRDSGSGIPDEALGQVFDPGFTTKSRGIGTGLGLAVAYQVAQEHRGSIAVDSSVETGTVVTLRLATNLGKLVAPQ